MTTQKWSLAALLKLAASELEIADPWPGSSPAQASVGHEYETDGFRDNPGKQVCPRCIADSALREAVFEDLQRDENGEYETGSCDYCDAVDIPIIPVDDVFEYIDRCLVPAYASAEEEWVPIENKWGESIAGNFSSSEILSELDDDLFASERLTVEFISAFDGRYWAKRDAMEMWKHEALAYGWERFANHVTYKQRYLFFDKAHESRSHPDEIEVGQLLHHLGRVFENTELIRKVPADTEIWRAPRQQRGKPLRHRRTTWPTTTG